MVVVKNPRSKAARNALISAGVLLVLFVVGGVVYTYFAGPDGTQGGAAAGPVVAPAEPVITPTKPAANATESAAVQIITSPVAPGANASMSVKTVAGSTCKIAVLYGTVASTDSGLATKVADDYGTVSWTWTVEKTAPLGTWPVKVTCTYHTRSAVVQGDLKVAK